MTFKFILNLIVKLKFSNEIWSIKIMSNFSIKQLYVLYKPAASVRVRYKLIHICRKSQRIFLSFDIVMIRIRILPLSQWICGNRSRDISPVEACALKSRGRFDDEKKNPGHFITRLFLKGRPGNEEAFNSTRNRISSLKVFHVLFYRRSIGLQDIYFLYRIRRFAPDWIENTCMKTRKTKGLDSREITSSPKSKYVMNMACHINHRLKYIACSSQDLQWKFIPPDQFAFLSKLSS